MRPPVRRLCVCASITRTNQRSPDERGGPDLVGWGGRSEIGAMLFEEEQPIDLQQTTIDAR
jgi:hypothetical protein